MKPSKLKQMTPYIILVVLAIIFALPLIWIILASFDANAASSVKVPTNWTVGNYVSVIKSQTNQRAFLNGLLISLGQSIIVVLVAILAAYPLSRYELRYKKIFMNTILFMTALPMTAVMVPVYKLFIAMKLYNRLFGVILFMSATSLPYATG
jgi:multiple sugar transport system permease protein